MACVSGKITHLEANPTRRDRRRNDTPTKKKPALRPKLEVHRGQARRELATVDEYGRRAGAIGNRSRPALYRYLVRTWRNPNTASGPQI